MLATTIATAPSFSLQVTVFSKDLRETAGVATTGGAQRGSKFELYDLVEIE